MTLKQQGKSVRPVSKVPVRHEQPPRDGERNREATGEYERETEKTQIQKVELLCRPVKERCKNSYYAESSLVP